MELCNYYLLYLKFYLNNICKTPCNGFGLTTVHKLCLKNSENAKQWLASNKLIQFFEIEDEILEKL